MASKALVLYLILFVVTGLVRIVLLRQYDEERKKDSNLSLQEFDNKKKGIILRYMENFSDVMTATMMIGVIVVPYVLILFQVISEFSRWNAQNAVLFLAPVGYLVVAVIGTAIRVSNFYVGETFSMLIEIIAALIMIYFYINCKVPVHDSDMSRKILENWNNHEFIHVSLNLKKPDLNNNIKKVNWSIGIYVTVRLITYAIIVICKGRCGEEIFGWIEFLCGITNFVFETICHNYFDIYSSQCIELMKAQNSSTNIHRRLFNYINVLFFLASSQECLIKILGVTRLYGDEDGKVIHYVLLIAEVSVIYLFIAIWKIHYGSSFIQTLPCLGPSVIGSSDQHATLEQLEQLHDQNDTLVSHVVRVTGECDKLAKVVRLRESERDWEKKRIEGLKVQMSNCEKYSKDLNYEVECLKQERQELAKALQCGGRELDLEKLKVVQLQIEMSNCEKYSKDIAYEVECLKQERQELAKALHYGERELVWEKSKVVQMQVQLSNCENRCRGLDSELECMIEEHGELLKDILDLRYRALFYKKHCRWLAINLDQVTAMCKELKSSGVLLEEQVLSHRESWKKLIDEAIKVKDKLEHYVGKT